MNRKDTALVSRRNWLETRAYLTYMVEVRRVKPGTVEVYRGATRIKTYTISRMRGYTGYHWAPDEPEY